MNVVDKFGRLIRLGVSSVVTPLHPFSGAVDIIVVKQPDGTYRSTPWYVQFGKFQGVLQGAEKIVSITVNGVEANFHMYLDNSGQAHFLHEVVPGSQGVDSNDQDSNDIESFRTRDDLDDILLEGTNLYNIEEDNLNVGDECEVKADDSKRLHGIQDEQLLIDNPSDSLGQSTHCDERFDNEQNLVKSSDSSNSEVILMSVDGHICTASISKKEKDSDNFQLSIDFHHGSGEASREDFDSSMDISANDLSGHSDSSANKDMGTFGHQNKSIEIEEAKEISICESEANNIGCTDMEGILEGTGVGPSKDEDAFMSCLDLTVHAEGDDSPDLRSSALELEMRKKSEDTLFFTDIPLEKGTENIDDSSRCCVLMPLPASDIPCSVDVPAAGMEIRDNGNKITDMSDQKDIQATDHVHPSKSVLHFDGRSQVINDVTEDSGNKLLDIENTIDEDPRVLSVPSVSTIRDQKDASSRQEIPVIEEPNCSGSQKISEFGFEISLCGDLIHPGMGRISAKEAFEAHQISENEFKSHGPEIIKNESLIVRYKEAYYQWDKVAHIIVGITLFGVEYTVDQSNSIPVEHAEEDLAVVKDREESHVDLLSAFSRGWRLWSLAFRRSKSLRRSSSNSSSDDIFLDAESCFPSTSEGHAQTISRNLSLGKNLLRTNIPTNEQISSLNLKDGQNTITFSCSARVFGRQQVDAHIYVWKWNARIVISDVDGTITRSDVLGQVMPLVGKDWTQSGVASLFSAIKENGYQLLFLSARAIVQSDLTKRFLSNLKQDGKVLPTGPVVISPDGLLPSFYREVIRRAPHEFKIACLKDIRSLFPSDYNPFYAGFGNRDTDELTYRKIGIPEGKIFIINPKGEVALHNCTDVRSYTSLHSLVDDMFPPTSLGEQEEYNSWNYWKLPCGSID